MLLANTWVRQTSLKKGKKKKSLNFHVRLYSCSRRPQKMPTSSSPKSARTHTTSTVQVFHVRRGRLRLASQHVTHCSFFYTSSVKQDSILLFCSSTKHPEHLTVAQNSGLILWNRLNYKPSQTEMIASLDSWTWTDIFKISLTRCSLVKRGKIFLLSLSENSLHPETWDLLIIRSDHHNCQNYKRS